MQFSYASMGARNTRKLGGQFMNGVSYMTGKGSGAAKTVAGKAIHRGGSTAAAKSGAKSSNVHRVNYTQPQSSQKNGGVKVTRVPAKQQAKTGTTYEAPKVTPRDISYTKGTEPKANNKDKAS